MVISSDSGYFITSLRNFISLMNISSPHEYADVSYQVSLMLLFLVYYNFL